MKLVKLLANLGYGSRKEVQRLIRAGAVTDINGRYAFLGLTAGSLAGWSLGKAAGARALARLEPARVELERPADQGLGGGPIRDPLELDHRRERVGPGELAHAILHGPDTEPLSREIGR